MIPYLYLADNMTVLRELDDNSLDSCVCDPPYGMKILGEKWDYQIPSVEFWTELLRVLKPGAHILVFCGTKTQHRMVVNIEDAGFEIRDVINWLYGQGMPKSYDVGKFIPDKQGWGTALKPACELITLARKPIDAATIVDNLLLYGTGALNIDASRIELNGEIVPINKLESWSGFGQVIRPDYTQTINVKGRWPANVILDEESSKLLDAQGDVAKASETRFLTRKRKGFMLSGSENNVQTANSPDTYGDGGGISRFFYCAKPSLKEKGSGNIHPSVKPIRLMEHLVRLVTPPKGICIDPFMGSGTTGIACKNLGIGFVGIEKDEGYFEIAQERINNA